jgi:hypothetical protein
LLDNTVGWWLNEHPDAREMVVTQQCTLAELVALIVRNKLHRVYVTEDNVLRSVISLADVIGVFMPKHDSLMDFLSF